MTGCGSIANKKEDGSWVKYVFGLMSEKKIIRLCSASRMTFRAQFYRTDPQNIGGQFGTLSGFLRNTFRKRTSQKSPEIDFRSKSFRTVFEKRTPVYSLAAPLLGLAKSIYYFYYCSIIIMSRALVLCKFKYKQNKLRTLKFRLILNCEIVLVESAKETARFSPVRL